MKNFPLPRIDTDNELKQLLLPFCRLTPNEVWTDGIHKVACIDAADETSVLNIFDEKAALALHDPPYNFIAFDEREIIEFVNWCEKWILISDKILNENSSLYIWLGADQNNHFQPLADFMKMMSPTDFKSRSFITMRNQRGYGTQKNWMAIRQELLYYTKGNPRFNINAEYTDIPKVLKGYYKKVNGKETENLERSKSEFIRAGNVWIDIQQVFYRMEENVNGCFAQKPLKAIERIIKAATDEAELTADFFSHSGTTLIASEILKRKCYTLDIDPLYCEITIRRLENFRLNNKTGWQNSNPFFNEISDSKLIKDYLHYKYDIKIEETPQLTL
jgi:site-specific DNA-methyltransferase (adenine-specific)